MTREEMKKLVQFTSEEDSWGDVHIRAKLVIKDDHVITKYGLSHRGVQEKVKEDMLERLYRTLYPRSNETYELLMNLRSRMDRTIPFTEMEEMFKKLKDLLHL